jgi:hypothetical protein
MKITTKIITAAAGLLAVGILVGCGQEYRYPCQDPANWEDAKCQKPVCAVRKECPDHIFKNDPDLTDYIKK